MRTAKDIMTRDVVTLTPDMDIIAAVHILLDKKINGAPVVEDGRVVGVLTQTDLVAQQKNLSLPSLFTLLDGFIPLSSTDHMEAEMRKIAALTVGQAMSGEVVSVGPDAPLADVANIMVDRKLHTVPVVQDGRLLGVIGKEDIIKTLLG